MKGVTCIVYLGTLSTPKTMQGQSPVRDMDSEHRRPFSPPPIMKVVTDGEPATDDMLQQLIMFDEIADASENDADSRSNTADISSTFQPVYIR